MISLFGKVIFLVLAVALPVTESGDFELFSADVEYESAECQSDVDEIAQGFINKEQWALKILDASTKLPSGIFTGHVVDYGNYDECLDDVHNVTTQYCTANLFPGNETELFGLVRWSYCMPKSCPPEFLERLLQTLLTDFNVNVTVQPENCRAKHRIHLALEDYVGLSIWGAFVALAVGSTVYDAACRLAATDISPVLASFSVYTNGIKLLNTKTTPETMTPLHGLRFLSICWIVMGHRVYFTIFSSLVNFSDFLLEMDKIRAQVFIQGVLAVDTFFLISGLLNCFHLLAVLDKTNKFPVVTYYVHRYLRLTPVLAAVVLMYSSWFILLGDGPLWFPMIEQWKQLCTDYWWSTILYINNYYNPTSQCAGQSWYLAVDMQLYWLSPFVILPLWRWPKFGKILLWSLLFLSTLTVFVIAYVYEFRSSYNIGFEGFDEFLRTTRMIYVPTHTRATPYVMGLMLGHYLHTLRKSKAYLVLSKVWVAVGWFATTAVCLSIILGSYQFTRPLEFHPYDRLESSFYISLHRIGWGMGMSWIIISCLYKNGGIVNLILSWKGFIPLSRLTYCIFLSHMAVQQYHIGTARSSGYFQYFNELHLYFGDLIFSILIAAVLSLIFESPVLVLEKLILRNPLEKKLKSEINDGYVAEPSFVNVKEGVL